VGSLASDQVYFPITGPKLRCVLEMIGTGMYPEGKQTLTDTGE